MTRDGARDQVIARVRAGGPTEAQQGQFARFQLWCLANDRRIPGAGTPDGEAERTVLEFVFSGRERWAFETQAGYVCAVAAVLGEVGVTVRGALIRRYLAAERRCKPPGLAPRTDAVTADVAQLMAALVADDVELLPAVCRRRGVLVVSRCLGWDPLSGQAQRLARSSFRRDPRGIAIRAEGTRGVVDAERDPEGFRFLSAALELDPGERLPLADPSVDAVAGRRCDRRALKRAWDRSHRPVGAQPNPNASPSWPLSDDDWTWWVRMVDPQLARRRRHRAYLLVGIVTANRHADMAALRMIDVVETVDGYACRMGLDKGAKIQRSAGLRKRRPNVKPVLHADAGGVRCGGHCPACALRDQVEVRRWQGASDDDYVFAGDTDLGAPMTLQGASQLLRSLYRSAGGAAVAGDGRQVSVSTRTLRATGVTLASEAGLRLLEIAMDLTFHESITTTAKYDRSRGRAADVERYALPLDDPSA